MYIEKGIIQSDSIDDLLNDKNVRSILNEKMIDLMDWDWPYVDLYVD